jgi:hypothetical protein
VDGTAGDHHVVERGQLVLGSAQHVEHRGDRLRVPVDLHLQRPDPGCHLDDTGDLGVSDPCRERVGAQSQVEVEDHRPVLDEDGAVPALPVRHLRRVTVGGAHREDTGCVLGR